MFGLGGEKFRSYDSQKRWVGARACEWIGERRGEGDKWRRSSKV